MSLIDLSSIYQIYQHKPTFELMLIEVLLQWELEKCTHPPINVHFFLHYLAWFIFNNMNLYFIAEHQGKETNAFFSTDGCSFKL